MIKFDPKNLLTNDFNYNNLSLYDLVEARDQFHVHLMNKKNVVATTIGRYRARNDQPWPHQKGCEEYVKKKNKGKRTLENSEVREYSWPCILVFVNEWVEYDKFRNMDIQDFIPRCVYMPDGRVIPLCVIEATKLDYVEESVDPSRIIFPTNFVGGGFPLIVESQGVQRIASIGCVVSDGNKYYALTNKHVVGTPGTTIFTRMKGVLTPIGRSSDKQIGNLDFASVYPGWKSQNLYINNDIGLIEIDDIRQWKTDVFGIGAYNKLADLNTLNLSLKLIGTPVSAFGSVSGKLQGEICAMFYRYKSVGGYEYAADFLIGPRNNGKKLETRHGDSGTLWLLEGEDGETKSITYMPIAVHWGQHSFVEDNGKSNSAYVLATCLSNVLRLLEVDLVRGWNLDQDYSWGKLGHFSIANVAVDFVSNNKLKQLMVANRELITFGFDKLTISKIDKGLKQLKKDFKFVPLADVPDLVWKGKIAGIKRGKESPNHFADMDKVDSTGKTLLKRCTGDFKNMKFLTPAEWLTYYEDDAVKDKSKGILPFRVWQIFNEMVQCCKDGNMEGFVSAAGVLSHYVGDACQPLHISFMFDGIPNGNGGKDGSGVHSVFETNMVNKFIGDILTEATKLVNNGSLGGVITVQNGKEAAGLTVKLMKRVLKLVKPKTLVDICVAHKNKGAAFKAEKMWEVVGKEKMGEIFGLGALYLASLWQSAWVKGKGGTNITNLDTADIPTVIAIYEDQKFIPSVNIKEIGQFTVDVVN
ncbi:MAG TPA: hypothetical protein VK589_01460 [Chryseolinea sp.]|nr:hypothetical protein [Chryseolinea sp.]